MVLNRIVDDCDPLIRYSTAVSSGQVDWNTQDFGQPEENNGTVSVSRRRGAMATFSFVGASVSVYGTLSQNGTVGPVSSYTIDGGLPEFYTAHVQAEPAYRRLFFRSKTLPVENHTLTIRNEINDDFFILDFVTYVSESSGVSPNAGFALAPSISQSFSVIPSSTSASFPTSSLPGSHDDGQSSRRHDMPAIVGGSIGALLLLSILGLIMTWRYMRRRRKIEDPFADPLPDLLPPSSTAVTPYFVNGRAQVPRIISEKPTMSPSNTGISEPTLDDPPPRYHSGLWE